MTKNKKNPSVSKTDSKKSKNKSKDSQNKTSDKKTTRSTSEKTNNGEDIKTRKTINVSIQKKNSDKLNDILNNWDEEELNLSNEVCKCILFKNELENNQVTQSLISTLNLIKITLKNKNLFEKSYDEAFITALKNIISININTQELCSLVENDLYFSNVSKTDNSSNDNLKHNLNTYKNFTKNNEYTEETIVTIPENENTCIEALNTFENSTDNHTKEVTPINDIINTTSIEGVNDTIAITQEKTTTNTTSSNNNECTNQNVSGIIRWDNIPEEPTVSNDGKDKNVSDIELLNKRLNAFSYPTS